MQYDLSVILPSRREMFLRNTVEDILKNKRANTEIIVVLDDQWADPPLTQHPDVNIIFASKPMGQRAATNLGVRLSRAPYVMKLDAHCSWDEGYDAKMLEGFKKVGDNVTMVGIMRNLHCFDWKCYHCGLRTYQGPTPTVCKQCGKSDKIRRRMVWEPRRNIKSTSYSFDSEPHFQYFEDYKHRPQYIEDKEKTGFTETMSLQGSCFMCTREKYWELELCGEDIGSWGGQGIEVACKAWLSGGRVLVNHNTWYSHLFRTQGGDFGFPYPQSGHAVQKTKENVKNLFWGNKWSQQIHPLSWLIEKFAPVPGWSGEDLKKLKEQENQNMVSAIN